MRTKKTNKKDQLVPAADFNNLRDLLGKPALLRGEAIEDYQAVEASLMASLKPGDAQEYIWVRDIVDLQWELLRMRQLKAKFLSSTSSEGLKTILQERGFDFTQFNPLAKKWATNDPNGVEAVRKLFEDWGLDESDILAKTYMKHIADLERLERITIGVETRRNSALHEFERHRATKKKFLHDITDVENDGD